MRTDGPERCARQGGRAARAAAAGLLAVALAGSGHASAQRAAGVRAADTTEIAAFRMTGIEGYVLGSYWRDMDNTTTLSGPAESGETSETKQTLSSISAKVFVMTHSYVYHPNLLTLDLGAGPVYFRNGYSSDGVDTTSNRITYDLSARATFLRDKPYRGALFYDRTNDSQPVGPAQSLLTQNTKYGFDAALLAPATPVPIYMDGYRFQSNGRGTDQVQDEDIAEVNFRAERAWGKLGDTTLRYQWQQDDSKSGSLGLPISKTRSLTNRADLDTILNLGANKQYALINTVSYNAIDFTTDQGSIADNRLFRFDVNLRARPTDALQTRLRYQFDAADQQAEAGPQRGRLNAINAGATYDAGNRLSGTLDALASVNRNTAFDANLAGINGSVNYRYELPVGELAANYGLTWYKRDQTAKEPTVQVVGERHILVGIAWATLRRPQILPGSVVVSNAERTQTFVEGRDYALQVIGLETQLERLIGGAILDGQEVLVDYSYDTGGTYAITEFDNTIDLTWRYKQYFSAYVRYGDFSPRLDSGTPMTPLNPATTTLYGTRADVPFELLGEKVQLGGVAEWEDRREVISPYTRTLYEAYAETSLPLIARGGLRVGARQQQTEYDLTPDQNLKQKTLTVRLWSRYRNGLMLEAEGTRTNDTGLPQVTREYSQARIRALWRIRRILLTLEFAATNESQGNVESRHTRAQLGLRRDF